MQPNCSSSKEFSEVVDSNIYIRESRGLTTTKVLSMRLLKVSEVRNNHKQVTISLALSPYQKLILHNSYQTVLSHLFSSCCLLPAAGFQLVVCWQSRHRRQLLVWHHFLHRLRRSSQFSPQLMYSQQNSSW